MQAYRKNKDRIDNKKQFHNVKERSAQNAPKRSLGQNFFTNQTLAERIAQSVLDSKPSTIIEIGPGKGAFTYFFNNKTKNLVLIEKDDTLAKSLQAYFPKAHIINQDFLEIDLIKEIIDKINIEKTNNDEIDCVVFGALPYNISKPIIKKCITELPNTTMFFIIQKEVADKYCAIHDSNILNIQSRYFGNFSKIFDIQPGNFFPRPKVVSTLIKFTPYDFLLKSVSELSGKSSISEENRILAFRNFEKLIFRAFRSPRKTIKNNLGYNEEVLREINSRYKTTANKYKSTDSISHNTEKESTTIPLDSDIEEENSKTVREFSYKDSLIRYLMLNGSKPRDFDTILKLRPQDVSLLEFLLLSEAIEKS